MKYPTSYVKKLYNRIEIGMMRDAVLEPDFHHTALNETEQHERHTVLTLFARTTFVLYCDFYILLYPFSSRVRCSG